MKTNHHIYRLTHLVLGTINVLPQPRQTFDVAEIVNLANDIASAGLLEPIIVGHFEKDRARKYLAAVNLQHHTQIKLAHLVVDKSDCYYILINGERRFRAFTHLDKIGCEECLSENGIRKVGVCLRRHFRGGRVPVSLVNNPSVVHALALQYKANMHTPVPVHEEAVAMRHYYDLIIRDYDAKLTLRTFAKMVGRSEDTVRKALRFCLLPDFIKEAVEKSTISFGIATELARLQEKGTDEDHLRDWLVTAVVKNYTVDDFRRKVSAHIETLNDGQHTLIELTSEQNNHHRGSVKRQTEIALRGANQHLMRVQALYDQGLLKTEDSPYTDAEIVRIVVDLYKRGKVLPKELRKVRCMIESNNLTNIPTRVLKNATDLLEVMESADLEKAQATVRS